MSQRRRDLRSWRLEGSLARRLAAQEVPAVGWKSAHVALARVGENVARMRAVLEASARAIPRPASPPEALVCLRRGPALVRVSNGALAHMRSFAIGHLHGVLAERFCERAGWERRGADDHPRGAQVRAPTRGSRCC